MRQISTKGAISALFYAINFYVPTSDHPGEGSATEMPDGDLGIVIPGHILDADHQKGALQFQRRIVEIQASGAVAVTLETFQGSEEAGCLRLSLALADAQPLAQELVRSCGSAGWGQGKQQIEESLPGIREKILNGEALSETAPTAPETAITIYECTECSALLPSGVMACPRCGTVFNEPVPTDTELPIVVYECDHCGAPLPAGARACLECGQEFNEAVPADAQLPAQSFNAASPPNDSSRQRFEFYSVKSPALAVVSQPEQAASLSSQMKAPPQIIVPPLVESQQVLGFLGASILLVGVFTPFLGRPAGGSISYFQNGWGEGTILVALAALSGMLVLTKKYAPLWLTGAMALSLLAYSFLSVLVRLAGIQNPIGPELADDPLNTLGDLFIQGVPILWGVALLVIGALTLLGAAAISGKATARPDLSWPMAAAALFLVLTGVSCALTHSEIIQLAETKVKASNRLGEAQRKALEMLNEPDRAAAKIPDGQDASRYLRRGRLEWPKTAYSRYIVGTVQNVSGRPLSYVFISLDLMDRHGHTVDTEEDYTRDFRSGKTVLGPGEKWSFKVKVTDASIHRAKTHSLKGRFTVQPLSTRTSLETTP